MGSKVNSVSTQIDHNIDVLHEALRSGDKTQVKESVTTIIEEVTYLLEVIEYRFVRIQKIPDNTQRENEYKILYIEIQFVIRKLITLENVSEKTDVLSPDILQNINESMNNAKQHIDNLETVQKHTAIESPKYDMRSIENKKLEKKINETLLLEETSKYDTVAIGDAETNYQEYLARSSGSSWANVVSQGKPNVDVEESKNPVDDKAFIMYQQKTVKVVVTDDNSERNNVTVASTDDNGFTEFVSKQERRRRLRSSCSESEELVKDVVPFVPRIELPEIGINDEKLKSKVNSVSTQIDHNIDVLHEALRSGDKAQVKESVTTIIEEVTYLLEVIEYRFVRIQKIPDNTQRENEYKILYIEIQFVIRKLTILENISEKTDVLSPDILQNINESMNNAKQHIDNFETVQKHNLPEDEENRNLQVTSIESPKYDMHSIEEAECLYQAYLAGNKNNDNKDNSDIVSYASVVAPGPTEVPPEAYIDPTEDRSFILLKTKTIKVVVEDDMDTRPRSFENETDEEGFTEYVSKQERRRRLQSSCSDDDSIKDLVPYVPRIELPEIEVCEEESMPLINESLTEKSIKVSISEEPETDTDDREEIQNEVEDEVLKIEESKKLKFIDDNQRKRQRTPISESEQEVDDILRLMNREEALQIYGSQESFWHEKWIAEDSECRYHELQTLNLKSPYLQTDSKTGVIDDIISHEGNIGTKVKSLDFHSVDEEEQSANFTDDTNVMIKSTLSPYAAEFVMPSECFVFSSGVGQSPVPDAEFIETQISQEYPSSQPVTCLESSHKLQPISKIDLTESSINEEK